MPATRLATTAAAVLGAAALVGVVAAGSEALGGDTEDKEPEAGTSYGFTVTPSTIAAGGRVTLAATGCKAPATASSGIFDTATVPPGGTVQAVVDQDAKPGAMYVVSFTCSGTKGSVPLTVAGGSAAPTTSSTSLPSPVSSPSPASSASPVQGVRGGLGGSIGGVDGVQVAGGAALTALALGGTFYAVRRRSAGPRRH
jgi:hypothetical protein